MSDLYTRKTLARIKQPDGHWGAPTWALVGDGPDGCEKIAKAPVGALKTSIKAPRDGGRHRYMFVLFQKAYHALPEGWNMSFETFRKALTVDAGYYDEVRTPDGNIIQVPMSLSYKSMDQATHDALRDDLIKCLVTRWIPGLDSEAFENEVLECLR